MFKSSKIRPLNMMFQHKFDAITLHLELDMCHNSNPLRKKHVSKNSNGFFTTTKSKKFCPILRQCNYIKLVKTSLTCCTISQFES